MKMAFVKTAVAVLTFACAVSASPDWSRQDGLSLSVSKADARARVYITRGYAASAAYYTATGLPWYAVRAYQYDGPWSGNGYSYSGWSDYQARTGIVCVPGTEIKGADGIIYLCQ